MNSMYAMQRSNGNWFVVNDAEGLRVPIFRSSNEAMQARARNAGMLLFKPVVLDERTLDDLALIDEGVVGFWLVTNPFVSFNRGRPLEHAQLTLLMRDLAEQQATPHADSSAGLPHLNLLPPNAMSATESREE